MKMFLVLQYDEAALTGSGFPSQSRMDLDCIRHNMENPRCCLGRVYDEITGEKVGDWTKAAGSNGIEMIEQLAQTE
ncbi:MAG: hypothetical protein WC455_16865 [Dehalococcoidia bacterium]|jgi:hypothetical protein